MQEFQAKRKIRKIVQSKTVIFFMLIGLFFLARATWNMYQKELVSEASIADTGKQLEKLQERQDLLKAAIARLSTNQGVEEEIRTKYSVKKPNEHLIVVVDDATSSATTSNSTDQQTEATSTGFFTSVKHFFGY